LNTSLSLSLFSILLALWALHNLYGNNNIPAHALTPEENTVGNIPIKHIIVIIQGRHSFDNYFGTFPNADGFPVGIKTPSNPFHPDNTTYIEPFHFEKPQNYKPRDDPLAYRLSYNNGSMNGFVFANREDVSDGSNVMGYYDSREIPYYWKFASEYVLAQRFFGPSMRSDIVNSLYAIGADPLPKLQDVPDRGLDINRTIFDELQRNKIPWKVYVENLTGIANLSDEEMKRLFNNIPILAVPRFNVNHSLTAHIDDLANYYGDIHNNRLASVNYVYFTKSNDSPTTRVLEAQGFVATLVYSLMKSHYWNNSAVIIAHNEAGGWFDHVKPPTNNNTNELAGFRVPALIISPYAKKGYIDNNTYDISSVLKFIESSFGINVLSERNNKSNNIIEAFDFTKPPREPLYLEEVSRDRIITESNDVNGVNTVYVFSLLLPMAVTVFWYYRKRRINKKVNR
jgi:phospholipase C